MSEKPLTTQARKASSKLQDQAAKSEPAQRGFKPPLTVSHPSLLVHGSDVSFRHVIYLFVEVLGRLTVCREFFGKRIGLTGSQFAVLVGVAYKQGAHGITIKGLAEYVHLAPTHVTTEVGRLIDRGLVVKQAAVDDKRSVLVSLSPEGENTVSNISPLVTQINDILFEGMTAEDLASTEALFTRLSRNSEFALAQIRVAQRDEQGVSSNPSGR